MARICKRGHNTAVTGEYSHGRCRACIIDRANAWNAANPEKKQISGRKTRRKQIGFANPHGEQKSGPCEICAAPTKTLDSDHNHTTGATRGWLCRACNWHLGYLETTTTEWLERAESYRKKYD